MFNQVRDNTNLNEKYDKQKMDIKVRIFFHFTVGRNYSLIRMFILLVTLVSVVAAAAGKLVL